MIIRHTCDILKGHLLHTLCQGSSYISLGTWSKWAINGHTEPFYLQFKSNGQ